MVQAVHVLMNEWLKLARELQFKGSAPFGSDRVLSMVDRTKYPADKVPDLALRQVFGRQKLSEPLCLEQRLD